LNYFLLRAWAPLLIIFLHYFLKEIKIIYSKAIYYLTQAIIIILTASILVIHLLGTKLSSIAGVNLTNQGIMFSLIFGLILINYSYKKTHDYCFSLISSSFAVLGLGWLYEIPFKMFLNYFFITNPDLIYYPFLIHSQIASLIFLYKTISKRGFKPSSLNLLCFLVYLCFSFYLFLYSNSLGSGWCPYLDSLKITGLVIRIPAALLLFSLFTKIK